MGASHPVGRGQGSAQDSPQQPSGPRITLPRMSVIPRLRKPRIEQSTATVTRKPGSQVHMGAICLNSV